MSMQDFQSGDVSVQERRRRHPKAIEFARRGLELVLSQTNELADEIMEQPAAAYMDPDRFATEIDLLFHKRPIFAALSAELPNPGDYKTLDVPQFPLVLARQSDGTLRAFLNSCRHRGSNVAYGSGSARTFVCKYHGWTYGLDGSLRKIRAEENFGDLDAGCTGLINVAVAEKHGLIFVRATPLDKDPDPIDIDEELCGMAEQLEMWQLDMVDRVSEATVHTASNWKLAVDTYLETYHFATLHKTTVAKSNLSDHAPYETYGPHGVVGFLTRNIAKLEEKPEEEWSPMKHVQMVYLLFPNTVMTVMQDHVEYSMILPGQEWHENKMHHLYFSFAGFESEEIHAKRFGKTQWILEEEDCPMAEEMHANLATGALPSVHYGRNEPILQHQHRSVDATLSEAASQR